RNGGVPKRKAYAGNLEGITARAGSGDQTTIKAQRR
ncbi:hypothetical protein CEXT_238851, partial [Caerostris extrusa]